MGSLGSSECKKQWKLMKTKNEHIHMMYPYFYFFDGYFLLSTMYIYIYMHIYVYIYMYIHTLHYITLHYVTLHFITLHYIALHYIALHYITLHTSMHACMQPSIHPSIPKCTYVRHVYVHYYNVLAWAYVRIYHFRVRQLIFRQVTHTHTHIYIYIYIYLCVCVTCVSMNEACREFVYQVWFFGSVPMECPSVRL